MPARVGRLDQISVARNVAAIVMAAPIHLTVTLVDGFITSPYITIRFLRRSITKNRKKIVNFHGRSEFAAQ